MYFVFIALYDVRIDDSSCDEENKKKRKLEFEGRIGKKISNRVDYHLRKKKARLLTENPTLQAGEEK